MILNMVVLHLGQVPFNALLVTPPLPFMATSLALEISRFILHLTQYPVSPIFNTSFLSLFSLIYEGLGAFRLKSFR